jgi:thiol-disulfide isomerase/thioredoxin
MSVECDKFRSTDLVGRQPFVVVFFSSWCRVCDKKMPMVQAAIEEMGDEVPFVGVVLDDDDTWQNVGPFVQRFGLTLPLVRGTRYRSFALGYNPMQSVPVVVVVGRDGYVVDLQVGYSPFDYNRLVGALEVAKRAPKSSPGRRRPHASPDADRSKGAPEREEPESAPLAPHMPESAAEPPRPTSAILRSVE